MSKQSDMNIDDLNTADDSPAETVTDPGPRFSIVPQVGSLDAILSSYTHCNVCGGRLHFNHCSDFSRNTTQEKASCPECGLDSRQILHRLQ